MCQALGSTPSSKKKKKKKCIAPLWANATYNHNENPLRNPLQLKGLTTENGSKRVTLGTLIDCSRECEIIDDYGEFPFGLAIPK